MRKKMKQKTILFIALFTSLILFSIINVIADDQIRPAPQTDSRGVGEQIRPANQQNLPSDGNGEYQPTQGSGYSSSKYSSRYDINLTTEISNTGVNGSSNATANASFVLNTKKNTMNYTIESSDLSSNETSAEIEINDTTPILYNLPIGEIKKGMISFAKEIEEYILEGKAWIKIKSFLFPNGELIGQIKIV